MAKHKLYNQSVVANSVDLSTHAESVEFDVNTEELPAAGFQELQNYNLAGVQVIGDIVIGFYQDFAAAKTYATLFTLWQNQTVFNLVIKNDAGATAATNPAFTFPVFVKKKPVISGTRGQRHMAPVTFSIAGVMTVATS